jgi:hypothetical protein
VFPHAGAAAAPAFVVLPQIFLIFATIGFHHGAANVVLDFFETVLDGVGV